ncbi:MAG: hypothetical protein B5M51_05920 [Anaerolinea sp. 4484_236]|nr:MAG: hypothetical protein B5M51_05920 [Anaerolinea sp. 4484_236]
MQKKITEKGALLTPDGELSQVGWSPHPLLDSNLEDARFYALRSLQFLRVKRWDYYAIFTPKRFFSATVADLGYAGNVFVYTLDFETGELHEEGLVIPLGKGIELPRNSTEGITSFSGQGATLTFTVKDGKRNLFIDWANFHDGRGIKAKIDLIEPTGHESMNLVIPIPPKRFYFNRKINCLPASGYIQYGDFREELRPNEALGSLDWGRGVWEYSSFWNWASASGFLPDGRNQNRLDLTFTPFKDRTARTNLGIIFSEVHQMFGRYNGHVILDDGEKLEIHDLIGFAEEHHARW